MFDPDLFISWMADQGTGSLRALIRDASWASGREGRPVTRWLSRLEALGAVTIDWRGGQWTANPCEITDLPGNTQTAVLTGARPAAPGFYRERGAVVMPQQPENSQLPLPAAVWLQYTDPSRLHEFAAAISATVVPCAAESSARSLSPFTPGPATAPPARDSPAELLDPVTGRFSPVNLTGRRPVPGLYKYTQFGRLDRYALLREPSRQAAPGHQNTSVPPTEQTWHSVDRRSGIHHVLRPSAFPLRWKADQEARRLGRSTLGRLTADLRAPLPLPHERTAVLCTGLASLRTADTEHYDGVPFHIADRIARTLHRRLETA
ncbi:hypothetical protein [Streptomyces griseocarneus]|uniref:hypothetical protein n=1 Tax=Streptomyces griseocarneus TaxID=51201 RepID=UPI00167D4BDE|nr:hypothetical protein [Streptomyces griseocarneus]MBZ6475852.1 hypothetical protein [Streptomyces griseocarneus]GHG50394.1 hypothetical protein GCM10018779_10470 [Streptomyces griseocarneus]